MVQKAPAWDWKALCPTAMASGGERPFGGIPPGPQYPSYSLYQPSLLAQNTGNPAINEHLQQRAAYCDRNDDQNGPRYLDAPFSISNYPANPTTYPTTLSDVSNQHTRREIPSYHSIHDGAGDPIPPQPETPKASSQRPSVDRAKILLSLAEEFIEAAHDLGSACETSYEGQEEEEYYNLLATGLGCIEAVLLKCKLQPGQEAAVRLYHGRILYEETEDLNEAEETLCKGIAIADRHKLFDLRYNMQHLLMKILLQTRRAAAFKSLEKIIKDAEAYQHFVWVYQFRFLQISFHLDGESGYPRDCKGALAVLRSVITLAERLRDAAIQALALAMKAWVSLRGLDPTEGFEQAQRSLATVRSLQSDPKVARLPHIAILAAFVDMSCYLHIFDPLQAKQRMQSMQNALGNSSEVVNISEDGSFEIPLPKERMLSCNRGDGLVRINEYGGLTIRLHWKPKSDIYNVGYLLSGIALTHKNSIDGHKSEHMLQEGIKRQACRSNVRGPFVRASLTFLDAQKHPDRPPRSMCSAASLKLWRQQLSCMMHLHLAFLLCTRSSWSIAKQHLNSAHIMTSSWSSPSVYMLCLLRYLEATYYQGTGQLRDALTMYDGLSTIEKGHAFDVDRAIDDIVLLANLNSMMILHNPQNENQQSVESRYALVSQYCSNHPSRQMQSAFQILKAMLPMTNTITGAKQALHVALEAAKVMQNNQLLCMVLNIMYWKFFSGVVGDQAEKSARASQSMAKRLGNGLWIFLSAGVLWEHLEAAGRADEAEACWEDMVDAAGLLPEGVREAVPGIGDLDPGRELKSEMRKPGWLTNWCEIFVLYEICCI